MKYTSDRNPCHAETLGNTVRVPVPIRSFCKWFVTQTLRAHQVADFDSSDRNESDCIICVVLRSGSLRSSDEKSL